MKKIMKNIPKVYHLQTNHHGDARYQFEIDMGDYRIFQSYRKTIAIFQVFPDPEGKRPVYLNKKYWDYSMTTRKYLYKFLRNCGKSVSNKTDILAGIESGEFVLTDF